jgi:hypothetical protein
MKRRAVFTTILLSCFLMNNTTAKPLQTKKKFSSPAQQFAGTWQVDRHDFREFSAPQDDVAAKLAREAAVLPVGQKVRIERTGSAALPGSIDPVSMKLAGPVGETLAMTILQPFEARLCDGFWSFVCEGPKKDYRDELIITEAEKWHRHVAERTAQWPDIHPISYTLVDMGKTYVLSAWVARNGELVFPVLLDGPAIDGSGSGFMAVYLKRIGN